MKLMTPEEAAPFVFESMFGKPASTQAVLNETAKMLRSLLVATYVIQLPVDESGNVTTYSIQLDYGT